MKDNYKIWEAISYAWTEIGLANGEYPNIAKEIKATHPEWSEVNRIILRDVCASFAVDSFLVFPCMAWAILPDWGYSEEYIRERMTKWYSRPVIINYANPIVVIGYALALSFSLDVRRKLKDAYNSL